MVSYSELFDDNTRRKAREFYLLCHNLKRWYSSGILVIMDACLTSSGLNYFNVVVPRVDVFYKNYIKNGKIKNTGDVLNNKNRLRSYLLSDFKNERVWDAFFDIVSFISSFRRGHESDIQALHRWAVSADYSDMKNDPVGRIEGVGINTLQYLRMQSGVDTIMPDKIIRRWIERYLKSNISDEMACISNGMNIADELKISPIELCWAIWIKESGESDKIPV